jgi:hypothetical protein
MDRGGSVKRQSCPRIYAALQPATDHTIDMDSDALDFRVAELRSSHFRVAILGDRAALSAFQSGGEGARVERMLPGLEIVPVDLSQPIIERPAALSERLAELHPDLALALVSVCDNLAHEPPPTSWFDWRQLELARRRPRHCCRSGGESMH